MGARGNLNDAIDSMQVGRQRPVVLARAQHQLGQALDGVGWVRGEVLP